MQPLFSPQGFKWLVKEHPTSIERVEFPQCGSICHPLNIPNATGG